MTTYRVAEIFRSLQGEGPSIGTPATFIRLQGCAVGCSWCDTKFSWPETGGSPMTIEQLGNATRREPYVAPLLVVTGGEPLAHPGISDLLAWSLGLWDRVEVETSGFYAPPIFNARLAYNWSPKLSRVTPKADATWTHERAFYLAGATCKIVVGTQDDFTEAVRRLMLGSIPRNRVVIMPQGVESLDLDDRMRWLAPLCIEYGYRLSPRLHIQLWGKERGR